MRRIIVKLLCRLCTKIDFTTLQIETLNYYDEHKPKDALKVYILRKYMLEQKLKKNSSVDNDEDWDY